MDSKCPICLDLHPNKTISCGHTYHKKCIDKWLSISNICPTCRSPQYPVSIKFRGLMSHNKYTDVSLFITYDKVMVRIQYYMTRWKLPWTKRVETYECRRYNKRSAQSMYRHLSFKDYELTCYARTIECDDDVKANRIENLILYR